MNQQGLIESITAALSAEPALRGLFLSGSYGRGTADAFSDVDLIALVEADDHAAFVARWRSVLERLAPVVYWVQRGQGRVLTNAVTDEWLRCDMVILPPAAPAIAFAPPSILTASTRPCRRACRRGVPTPRSFVT